MRVRLPFALLAGFILLFLIRSFQYALIPRSHPTEGVLMRRMRTGRDAAPEGSASSTEPPGASGDTARPNYMGPSGNGLVGADERGGNPVESRAFVNGRPCPFPEGGLGA